MYALENTPDFAKFLAGITDVSLRFWCFAYRAEKVVVAVAVDAYMNC